MGLSSFLNMPSGEENLVKEKSNQKTIAKLASEFKVKALVVDDIALNRDVLTKLLNMIGADVIEAENGEEAVKKTREHHPDIILMDMRMPVMDGEEAVKKIQSEFGKDRFKVVAVTASALDRHRDYYLDLGFHEFIGKPFKEH